jgi:hypothetical protein
VAGKLDARVPQIERAGHISLQELACVLNPFRKHTGEAHLVQENEQDVWLTALSVAGSLGSDVRRCDSRADGGRLFDEISPIHG